MKKLILLIFILLLSIGLTACEGNVNRSDVEIYIRVVNPVTNEYDSSEDFDNLTWKWSSGERVNENINVEFLNKDVKIKIPKHGNEGEDDILSYSVPEKIPTKAGIHKLFFKVIPKVAKGIEVINTGKNLTIDLVIYDVLQLGVSASVYMEDNEDTETASFLGTQKVFQFTAPQNGEYVFKTYGDVPNVLSLEGADIVNSKDKKNNIASIKLESGQTAEITTSAIDESARTEYNITSEFIPNEMEKGQTKTIEIDPTDSEYVSIDVDSPQVISWSCSGGELSISILYENINNVIDSHFDEKENPSGSFVADKRGRYYIKMYNPSHYGLDIEVKLGEPVELCNNTTLETANPYRQVYKICPQYTSSYDIYVNGCSLILYNSDLSLVTQQWDETSISMKVLLYAGQTYYLSLESLTSENLELFFYLSVDPLSFGENNLTKKENTALYEIPHVYTDVNIALNISGQNEVKLFDNHMLEIPLTSTLKEGQNYYIGVKGDENNFKIDILPITSGDHGEMPESGFVVTELQCDIGGDYIVEDVSSFMWLNSDFVPVSKNLEAGKSYYLKVVGTAGCPYSVNLVLNAPQLSFAVPNRVGDECYKLVVEEAGSYVFKVYNTIGSKAELYDNNREHIYSIQSSQDEHVMELAIGTYYVDVDEFCDILIKKQNSVDAEEIEIFESRGYVRFDMIKNVENKTLFKCEKTARYNIVLDCLFNIELHFSVSSDGIDIPFDIKKESDMSHRYVISAELLAGKAYNFSFGYENTAHETLDCFMSIYIPTRIESIFIDGEEFFNGSVAQKLLNLEMGKSYDIVVRCNSDATAREFTISTSYTNPYGIFNIDGCTLHIGFDSNAGYANFKLIFIDDFAQINIVAIININSTHL